MNKVIKLERVYLMWELDKRYDGLTFDTLDKLAVELGYFSATDFFDEKTDSYIIDLGVLDDVEITYLLLKNPIYRKLLDL